MQLRQVLHLFPTRSMLQFTCAQATFSNDSFFYIYACKSSFAVSACECHVRLYMRSLCLLSLCLYVAGIMKVWPVCKRQLAHGMHMSTKLHVSKILVLGILQTQDSPLVTTLSTSECSCGSLHTF